MSDRIGVVVRLRKLRERHAQKDLADVRLRVEQARARLEALREPMFDGGGALGLEHLIALRAQGVVRAEELEDARVALEESYATMNAAVATVQTATSRRRAAESLEERRRIARAAVAARAAQAALDEVVIMRRAWHDQSADDSGDDDV